MSCCPELSTVNSNAAAVSVNGVIPLGSVIRKRGTKTCNGAFPVDLVGNTVVVSESGYYRFVFNAVLTAPDPGNVTISLLQNGVAVPGYVGVATISIANTQVATITLGAPDIRVFCNGVPSAFTFVVTGAAANFSNVAVSVKKI